MDNFLKSIRELGEKVTAPINNIMKAVSGMVSPIENTAKKALENINSHFDSLKSKIKESKLELNKLEKAFEDAMPGSHKAEALAVLEQQQAQVKQLAEQLDGLKKRDGTWTKLATGAELLSKFVSKVADSLDFSVVYRNLRVEIQRMTDMTDEQLDNATKKSKAIADGYGQDANLIAKTANSMTEQIGGSFDGNLDLLEEGLKRGANINGDFLDAMREYAPAIRETGMSASEAIAFIAQANKKGISSDKALETIKNATSSLQEIEMGAAQISALNGVGLKPEDIEGKATIDTLKLISSKMQGQTALVKQKILDDIFKGAGDEAGSMLLEEFSNMELDITKTPAVEQAGSSFRMWLSNLQSSIAAHLGDLGTYAQTLAPFLEILASSIPLVQALTKATWFQSIAQKVLNIEMSLNPIGIIIASIVLLTVLVYNAIDSFHTWGSTILLLMGPFGMLISGIVLIKEHWDSIVEAFKADGMIGALKRVGIVLLDVIMHPLERILGWVANLTDWEWAKDAANSVNEFRAKNALITTGENTPTVVPDMPASPQDWRNSTSILDSAKSKTDGGINALIAGNTVSFNTPGADKNSNKNSNHVNGLDVGSGAGGMRSITMNLDVTNNFSLSKDGNIRDIAEKVTGMINDRLRDAVVNLG